jgi:succinate dehydrogenase / fumarate reductase membrane anchor subunit
VKKAVSGLRAWMVQRFTAIYLLLFIVCALLRFVLVRPHSYEDWQRWMAAPAMLFASALFFAALLLHAWVGLRDVMMDYVHPLPLRLALLAVLAFVLVGLGLWAMQILLLAARP